MTLLVLIGGLVALSLAGVPLAPMMWVAFYKALTPGDLVAVVAYLRPGPAVRNAVPLPEYKRPVPREAVDEAIGRIEEKLLSSAQREVKSEKIGELVMRELKRLDKVAYIRFASVYRSFEDVDEFAEVVKEVRPARRRRA
jgi:intein/homing endonuclease